MPEAVKLGDIDQAVSFLRRIAHTSKSNVWLCQFKATRERCAVKEIFINRIANTDHVLNERLVLQTLTGSGVSPDLLATSKNAHSLFLVMELIEGAPVCMQIPSEGYSEQVAREVFAQTVRIIEKIHNLNIVYRDIKLSNLLIRYTDGKVMLCDFGTAKPLASIRDRMNSVCGTLHAMAPDIQSGNYDFRVDFWSLGILLFELLVGKPPFGYENVDTSAPILFDDIRKFSPEAKSVISRLLERDPRSRLASFSDLWAHSYLQNWHEAKVPSDPSIASKFIFGNYSFENF